MNKTINIDVPEGFEIDTENSNLKEGRIVFKKKEATPWRYNRNATISGYYVTSEANIEDVQYLFNVSNAWNVFATKKQAKSMLAMAQLSQIMQNDPRFGKPITNDDWNDTEVAKYTIERAGDGITTDVWWRRYQFLAFRTAAQRNLFLEENEDLIRQYFMLD